MKKIVCILFCAFTTLAIHAQHISGTWNGTLNIQGIKLSIIIHFTKDKDGKEYCTMDSPDQNASGIPADILYITDDSINIAIPQINLALTGKKKEEKIICNFNQNGMQFPLILQPGELVRQRPQTPQPPFFYGTREVTFTNKEANATFSGTLTYPINYIKGKKFPVVLLVSGSGLQDRDEQLFMHKPFLVIADALAKNGIASLRYDDRGYAKSTGDPTNATTADFAQDALAGINFLKQQTDFNKIGIIGHSEGANIAMILAAQQQADFIVSMAGPGIKGDSTLYYQNMWLQKITGSNTTYSLQQIRDSIHKANNAWLNYFIDYDPSQDIRAIKCPVMAINGSNDIQVLADVNMRALKHKLPANSKHLFKEYPTLNHLFQHSKTGSPQEYSTIEETISAKVLSDICKWIHQLY